VLSLKELLDQGDRMMYDAKKRKRNGQTTAESGLRQ
jgi:hypothetical protein